MVEQWHAIVVDDAALADARWPDDAPFAVGQVRSYGTVITDPMHEGMMAVPIDGPPGERHWNANARDFDPPLPAPPGPPDWAANYNAAQGTAEKLDVIAEFLGITGG